MGIIRRASERGKPLPPQLRQALEIQAGLCKRDDDQPVVAFHINQQNEKINLNGVSDAPVAAQNAQMQTFVTQPKNTRPMAFAANQRDEVRNLHDVAGALGAQMGMKQQTFITSGIEQEPANILCLNDQGGQYMNCSENITGTLRAQMNQHQPLVLESNQRQAVVREDGKAATLPASMEMGGGYVPMVYENHGIDARYTGPHPISPTLSARAGTGGNNVPLVGNEPDVYCIVGNVIDRQPENGGNGCGYQENISYTLTAMDRHAVFSRQRVDVFQENNVVSTESARQQKDATDLVAQPYQETVGTLVRSDHKGIGNQYVNDDKCIVENTNLIRRLTPLECERLQGYPDCWTEIPGGSDSARYKALGNSVAIPCVEYVLRGIIAVLRKNYEGQK